MAKRSLMLSIFNDHTGCCLARQARLADTFSRRLRGLLGKRSLEQGRDGLLLSPCCAVHTLGMLFPIDLLFLSQTWKVLRTIPSFPPARLSPHVKDACHVLELPQGMIAATGTKRGHHLIISGHKNFGTQ
ncbi:MAG TPA: DUF192 domain-containing protein [Firmicutes bacterium]|nr:DUF192 domain-containing protein [Bacillota bacterium]